LEYLTGLFKTTGHVVLEKADVRGICAAMAICGDLSFPEGERKAFAVTGELKGSLALFFSKDFVGGISKYGADYLQAAVFGFSTSPAGKAPIIGPGSEFGTGSAGILAAGENAYVYVTEGSGMCIVRTAQVFGKKKFVKCISQEFGGEDVLSPEEGCALIACPEKWADDFLLSASGEELERVMAVLDATDISSDESLDRHIGELAGDDFDGCICALLVK
jgi:hypothetical protein